MSKETRVVTGEVRFSYCHIWEPEAIEAGGDPKYSLSVLIPKSDTETIQRINAALSAVLVVGKAKLAGKTGTINTATLKLPTRDGDAERPDDEAYRGHYFVTVNSKMKPEIVDEFSNPIINQSEVYSGCYGRVSINFYAFDFKGKKGIAAGLGNIQKLRDGTSLAGGVSAAEDFGVGTQPAAGQDYTNLLG